MRFLNSTPGSSTILGDLSSGGLTDGLIERVQQINARTLDITVTAPAGETFATGAEFFFSHSGRQEVAIQNTLAQFIAIPEPSRALLLGLGGVMAALSRRRRMM